MKIHNKIILLLISAFFLRLLLSPFGTLVLDQNTFIAWSNRLVEVGFKDFYSAWSDYLPGYLYVLWFLGFIKGLIPIASVILYKLPAIFSDLAVGYIIYSLLARKDKEKALIASALYLFNPAIIINSTLWGQVDGITALFALLAISLLDKYLIFSSLSFGIGMLIKPQMIFVAPIIVLQILSGKEKLKNSLIYLCFSIIVVLLMFLPFSQGNIFKFIVERLNATLTQYPYTSINAFNFWAIWGMWKDDTTGAISSQVTGYLLSISIGLLALFKSNKVTRKHKWVFPYLLVANSFMVSFMFFTRIHERHMLPLFAPLAISAAIFPSLWVSYMLFSVGYVLNMLYSYVWISNDFKAIFDNGTITALSIINIISSIILVSVPFIPKFSFKNFKSKNHFKFPESIVSDKFAKRILWLVILFAFLSRVFILWQPKNEYFDEVYHAFTARTMLHNDPKAWEWWNTPPEGFAYEWTHPPIAKEIMWLGMTLFGENAFGWRFPAAVASTLSVYLIYLISKSLFKDEWLAVLASFVYSLDGLPLVMGRIGMNDSYFLLFALLSFYTFINDKHFFGSIFLGLAGASKWSTLWFLPILAISYFVLKKKFRLSLLWYGIIPPIIYIGSYLPMFLQGHAWNIFTGVQKQMWWYHTNLVATHAYTSPWWSWPLLLRPIWLYTSQTSKGFVSNIYAMGNPLIFWFGLSAILYLLYTAFITKNKKVGLIVFSYAVLFAPWALSPRIMFLYHYLPSIPFLAIASGIVLRKHQEYIKIILIPAFLLFLFFYPHWTGIPVPQWLDSIYYWLPSWK